MKSFISDEDWDEFLDSSTHSLADRWLQATGRKLDMHELMDLNDSIASFFESKRYEEEE